VRFALTNATETRFVITTNARQLRHMFNLSAASGPSGDTGVVYRATNEYKKIAPNISTEREPHATIWDTARRENVLWQGADS
jgi:thymidylate synthase ThyX